MYEAYFGLNEKPFTIAPDPRYVFLSGGHEEALAHLLYGVHEGGGFVQLTGEVGTGKTTLVRTLLEQLPENVDLALIFNPRLSPLEFVAAVCDEFRIPYDAERATLKTLVDALNEWLFNGFSNGRRAVLIIDEAQGLSVDVLEQVRLLTNLETNREKLLEIILVGQPELRQILKRSDLRQLAQRITARYHLEPLRSSEIRSYVEHRLGIAGSNKNLYTDSAIRALYKVSGGIPRLINEIADRALLAAYVQEKSSVDARMVREASHQVLGDDEETSIAWWWGVAAGFLVLVAVAATFWWTQGRFQLNAGQVAQSPGPVSEVQEPAGTVVQSLPSASDEPTVNNPRQIAEQESAVVAEASPILIENGVSRPYVETAPVAQVETATNAGTSEPAAAVVEVDLVEETLTQTIPEPGPETDKAEAVDAVAVAEVSTEPVDARVEQAIEVEGESSPTQVTEAAAPLPVETTAATQVTKEERLVFSDWLAQQVVNNSEELAWRELAGMWGLPVDSLQEPVCNNILSNGYRCDNFVGNWTRIMQLNRPVILKLQPAGSEAVWLPLVAMDENSIALHDGETVQRFFRQEVEPYWYGEFSILWHVPRVVPDGLITPGERGVEVVWLRERLHEISGFEIPRETDLEAYDEPLYQHVILFQLANQLEPDGIVGNQTLMRLTSLSPSEHGPRLLGR